jgi:hypothetical protein
LSQGELGANAMIGPLVSYFASSFFPSRASFFAKFIILEYFKG